MNIGSVINIRYALIRDMDVSNGEGISVSLFVQGCLLHCKGCFNKRTWDFSKGNEWNKEIEDKFIEFCQKSYITHVSILGGEPLQQDDSLLLLLQRIKKEVRKPIFLWTGYEFENIPHDKIDILNFVDRITDGKFIEELKDFNLKFKGSSNQRVFLKGIDF
jgi:anaerobic ribonucleoside-triphosphate reductase activating protein